MINIVENVVDLLDGLDGVLIPGGFGTRGYEGKTIATRYCRLNKIPFLGICLALQLAATDIAKDFNPKACHAELYENEPSENHVIVYMPEYIGENNKGGSMRLGAKITRLSEGTLAYRLYDNKSEISERHRHRYEVNPLYVDRLIDAGVIFSGTDETGKRMSILELPDHPFFLCTQYHPEYNSTPITPSPPFLGFILASKNLLSDRFKNFNNKLCSGYRYKN